jgi:hypothetical protein
MEALAALAETTAASDGDSQQEAAGEADPYSSDASADSAWAPDSEDGVSSGNELLPSEGGEDSSDSDAEDTSIISIGKDLRDTVTQLIQEDPCEKKCLQGKAGQLEQFLCSLSQMTGGKKKQSIMTTLAVLKKTDTVLHHRDYGLREQFNYFLPIVGQVCRAAWCKCYGVSTATVTRYRSRINEGAFSVKAHGNKLNQNASAVDLRWLVSWFKSFAASVGEVMPVHVRRQKTKDGVIQLYYSDAEYTLLPAIFTWAKLHEEMHNYVELGLCVREPRPSTFRQYLTKLCPTIRIRSPRSNVCDVCSIYWSRMQSAATAAET